MSRYQLRFWFEHGGPCIWGMNDKAKEKFGYPIENDKLPISANLIKMLNSLEDEYGTYLDWNCPSNPSPWSEEHKASFLNKANIAYERLKSELGADYQIENKINKCV